MYNESFTQLEAFFEKYRLTLYKKGQIIFRPGDIFSNVHFIKNGYVRLYSIDIDGNEITFNTFKSVFLLSYYYAKFRQENRFYFKAVTDTEIYQAPREDFFEFLEKNPGIANSVAEMYMRKFVELLADNENSLSGNAHEKVANIMFSLAKKYGKKTKKGLVVEFNLTHEIIASLSGITRETATIQISKLEKENFFKRSGKNLIINTKKYFEDCS